MKYQVMVGTVCVLVDTDDKALARSTYLEAVKASKQPDGGHPLETVTLITDGEFAYSVNLRETLCLTDLLKALGVWETCDVAIPHEYHKAISALMGFNVQGHIVWRYPPGREEGHIFGKPYGVTQKGKDAIDFFNCWIDRKPNEETS